MGYKPNRKIFDLKFEDDQYDGLEVFAHSVSTGTILEIQGLVTKVKSEQENIASIKLLLAEFAKVLVSWNVEDDDSQPIPATLEGLLSQEVDFVMAIISAWSSAVAGVNPTLPNDANDGEISLAASIPMVPLSNSPVS